MGKPVGFWVNDYTYRLYDDRTHNTKQIAVMSIDGLPAEPEEMQDIVEEYKEQFAAECALMPNHVDMEISQQHELAPHLRSIEESKRRMRETGNRRYY